MLGTSNSGSNTLLSLNVSGQWSREFQPLCFPYLDFSRLAVTRAWFFALNKLTFEGKGLTVTLARVLCEGVGLVKRVHTLSGGVHRFATNLKEVEEVRQEVREVKDEENGEINVEGEPHTSWAYGGWLWNDGHSSDLSHAVQCAMWRCSDRQRDYLCTHMFVLMCYVWKSVLVVMLSLVSVVESCNVTTQT